ncbi:unnamed protein product [Moneuplotes crassus]|uniref:LITAF domain-containing protein n=1 Tax=Euplotes crassus TaxID=5936 RepID=A0AAD1XRT1_EUPCR|nr:unnamed protein product [Moneuplotes crassus]
MNNIRSDVNPRAARYGGSNPAANPAGFGPNAPGGVPNPQYQRVPQQPDYNYGDIIDSNSARYISTKIPVRAKCRYCQSTSITRVSTRTSQTQWMACFLMFMLCSWCCCCIPFCIKDCKSYIHHCGMCDREIFACTPEFSQYMSNLREAQTIQRDMERERQRMNRRNQYNTFSQGAGRRLGDYQDNQQPQEG